MQWNWEHDDWPNFQFDAQALNVLEATFLQKAGELCGVFLHVSKEEQQRLEIEFLSEEAIKSSMIEGEVLNRPSVQSSIQGNFGVAIPESPMSLPREQGMADLLCNAYSTFPDPLDHGSLFQWHQQLLGGTLWADDVGCYRQDHDAMQVVSRKVHSPKVRFQAPPSHLLSVEMDRFLQFFEDTQPTPFSLPLPALTRAGLAHLHFLAIHPFADGNGHLARVISQKALWQAIGRPYLSSLSHFLESNRKQYFDALESTNKTLEVTDWLLFFAETVIKSLHYSQSTLEFLLGKTSFLDQFSTQLNPRQLKVLRRLFQAGPQGFEGGLSAGNYQTITKTSSATSRRDLNELVQLGALIRTGERKGTRYFLNLR